MPEQIILLPHSRLVRHARNMRVRYKLPEVRRMAVSQADRARRGELPCVQPLVVTPGIGKKYSAKSRQPLIIVAGHLRHAGNAYLKDKAPHLNCIVRHYQSESEMLADMSAENGIRADVSPLGWARHFQGQMDDGKDVPQIARDSGKDVASVKRFLSLLELSQAAQDLIDRGDVPVRAVEYLKLVPSLQEQAKAARRFAQSHARLESIRISCEALAFKNGHKNSRNGHNKNGHLKITTKVVTRPATDGLPSRLPVSVETLRDGARATCAACEIGQKLRLKEPAWHYAMHAAGATCEECDVKSVEGACRGCPLREMMSRMVRTVKARG